MEDNEYHELNVSYLDSLNHIAAVCQPNKPEYTTTAAASSSSSSSMSAPVSVPMGKRPACRPPHICWGYFTDAPKPWQLKSAICRSCLKEVLYWNKAQTAINHLKNCKPFRDAMEEVSQPLQPDFCAEWRALEMRRLKRKRQGNGTDTDTDTRTSVTTTPNPHPFEEAYSFLLDPIKLLDQQETLRLLSEFGVEEAGDLRLLDAARVDALAKCLKFVPGRKFLELFS